MSHHEIIHPENGDVEDHVAGLCLIPTCPSFIQGLPLACASFTPVLPLSEGFPPAYWMSVSRACGPDPWARSDLSALRGNESPERGSRYSVHCKLATGLIRIPGENMISYM